MNANRKFISVVVCTYNRADLLERCLESLEKQILEQACFEVLIVDNNSTDGTKSVADRFCHNNGCFRYLFEGTQGLSHARNRGWKEASGDYVGYIDDDAKAAPEWLETARRVAAEKRPDIFGGPCYAFYNGPRPRWFLDRYGSKHWGPSARELEAGEYLNGTNIFFKKELLSHLGGFNPDLGMSGTKMAYGEETALIMSAQDRVPDLQVYYDPDLSVFHLVTPHRMELSRIARQRFVAGQWSCRVRESQGRMLHRGILFTGTQATFLALYFGLDLLMSLFRNRSVHPFPHNYIYDHSFQVLAWLGSAWGQFTASLKRSFRSQA
jgi:glucosyl-dolichyl phosphate glucuronosyltransferase